MKQMISINVHHAKVKKIHRLSGDGCDHVLVVTLGNDEYHGDVNLLVSDQELDALLLDVAEKRAEMMVR